MGCGISMRAGPAPVALTVTSIEWVPCSALSEETRIVVGKPLTDAKPAVLLSNEISGVVVNCRQTVIALPPYG